MNDSSKGVYRIGIDARFFAKQHAGFSRYSRELLTHLAAIDQQNQYFVFLTPEGMAEWTIVQANFQPVVVEVAHFSVAEQTKFLATLYRQKLDLVHFLNFNHPILYHQPFVATLHDFTLFKFPAGRSRTSLVRKLAFEYVFGRAYRRAKRVIAVSENSAKDAEQQLKLSPLKMEVILEGAPERQEIPFGSKARLQEYLGTRDPYVLFLSSWYPHKGIFTLLEAFALFKQQTGLPHKLVLAGRQRSVSEHLKQQLAAHAYASDILMPGFVPDEVLPSLYAHASVYVMPSEYEGFGLPILEAMTYGTPVIGADNSSIPEVIGKAGLLFPTRDSGALAGRLQEILTNPERVSELKEKMPAQLKKFSWSKMAKQTLAVYESVLEKRR